jgi:dTDP-glucose 4,6-dehydratase
MSRGPAGIDIADLDEALVRAQPVLAELNGASVFLTGGTGFFGRWLLALLAHARGRLGIELRLTLLSRSPDVFSRAYPELASPDWVKLVAGDIRSFSFPEGRFTHVIHAATDTSQVADRDAMALVASIVDGTRRVLDFAAGSGVRRLLYVSSGAIYGAQPADLPAIPESYPGACGPLDPGSAYGRAKRLAEQLCTVAAAESGLEIVIARAFAFVGPHLPLDGHFAIGNFIGQAVRGDTIEVASDGTALRSYLYAGDLAAWLLTLLVRGVPGAAYNVGSDQTISIGELAGMVASIVRTARGVLVRGRQQADGGRNRYVPSISKARAELGLDVWTPLEAAIRRTADYALRSAAPSLVQD